MTHDFVKPKKIGGLDTNTHAGQRSPFAGRPFLATPRSQPQPQDIQTMRERAARYQAANPHLYGTSAQLQTVQRQASETEEESLQMKANESVQRKPEQPDLQTLIRQRAARAYTPLQRMMKVQMAEYQGLDRDKEDIQMRQESSVQREAMPEEQEKKKPEDIQAKTEPQPEDLEKEEDIPPVQATAESEPEDLEKKPEDIQPKLNSTVQAQDDLDKEKPEDLQAKADSQPEDLEEEDSTPVQTKAEPTETLEEETKLQEKQDLNVLSQPSQQEEEVELQQKVNQAIQQQKLDEHKKDAQLQTRIDRSIQRQKLNKDRDQGHLQRQINHAVQHQELEKQQEETQLQRRINRAIQKQKAREDDHLLKAPPAKTQSIRPKSFQTKLQNKLQTKLTVGKPGDKYEREADNMAAKVMAMPETEQKIPQETELAPKQEEPEVQMRSLANSITSVGHGQLTGKPQSVVQNKEGQSSTQPGLESRLASQQGQGSPLPDETRNFMESRFGAYFGNVRVHTGSQAVQMNQEWGHRRLLTGMMFTLILGSLIRGPVVGKSCWPMS
ncbi:MAG: DUF4157 domain-containing protein [Crocosphaera sp.]|nr:DUF4157 domain-containing protein [Crocosphaera sp.]